MVGTRDFSDSVKLSIIKNNLENNKGEICCEICGKKLCSIKECHFDHIIPYAKGGKSIISNCQILCVDCNLKKNDKELQDFILEEKARLFLLGESSENFKPEQNKYEESYLTNEITKESFDHQINAFIKRKGDIHQVDFSREYNHLPSIHYVKKYYGDLSTLKKTFGIEDLSSNWNRDTIRFALEKYIAEHDDILQKDLTKKNKLPSLPCILSNYPEYKNFTDIKQNLCNLSVPEKWTVDTAIQAGRKYVQRKGKITQNILGTENHLPTTRVINNLFGSLFAYQEAVGSKVSVRNELITEENIKKAIDTVFDGKEKTVQSRNHFFSIFPYSPSTIHKHYGSFSAFCDKYEITVINRKKAKYTKQEVDAAITRWVKAGNKIPPVKDLTKHGLPSMGVIMKYYENWKQPFEYFQKMNEQINGD